MVLSVIGGLAILGVGIMFALAGTVYEDLDVGATPGLEDLGVEVADILLTMGIIGVVVGGIIVVLGIVMYTSPQTSTALGVIILVLSLVSITGGGGFLIGLVLGLVGGILGIVFKPEPAVPTYDTSQMQPPPPSQ